MVMAFGCKQRSNSRYSRLWLPLLVLWLSPAGAIAAPASPSVAFYYGLEIPYTELAAFDWVVLQPDHVAPADLAQLKPATEALAYISVGEVAREARYQDQIVPAWIVAENPAWNSLVLDLREPAVRQFLLDQLVAPVIGAGFGGVFLDTLDSYHLAASDTASRRLYEVALVEFIRQLRATWPHLTIIMNRGFEVLPQVHALVNAVAAESLFAGYDAAQAGYVEVPEADRQWLLGRFEEARGFGLPVIAVDYLPADRWREAEALARRIEAAGAIPSINNGQLELLGRSKVQPVARKILGLFSGAPSFAASDLHREVQAPLEYLGYELMGLDVERQALPQESLLNRYAGILVAVPGEVAAELDLCAWLLPQAEAGVPILLWGNAPVDAHCLDRLGFKLQSPPGQQPLAVVQQHARVGRFEAPLRLRRINLPPLRHPAAEVWLQLQTADKTSVYDAMGVTSWGGFAFHPYLLDRNPARTPAWIPDPYALLSAALRLAPLPAPDVTTENGRRILLAHIDGDGFVSRAEMPGDLLAAEVIENQVLKHYGLPHTVSIIEGEIGAQGMYPQQASRYEAVARRIFGLDRVEIASHTFSHPFYWGIFDGREVPDTTMYGAHMKIPGYQADLGREIRGSVAYINERLAPAGKPVKVFLWSGDAAPGEEAVRLTRELGLVNVNGGDTRGTRDNFGLTNVWPTGIRLGRELQLYAPVMNENLYTNLWQGPYYGFRDAIETFELLEHPRRLKPINIYYHFYSGSKLGALDALHKLYEWALAQGVNPLYLSDYAMRAQGLYRFSLARDLAGGWQVRHGQQVRTLRVPLSLGEPDVQASTGILGSTVVGSVRYVHLHPEKPQRLVLTAGAPIAGNAPPSLVATNAQVRKWQVTDAGVDLQLAGYLPLEVDIDVRGQGRLAGAALPCTLVTPQGKIQGVWTGKDVIRFKLKETDTGAARLVCR